jgi:predicted DNA-binding transcriptional regulator YafY
VDARTVRRYIMALQDLGIPVETERGRHGGYRLRPGFKLPPLLFTDEEAMALVIGLLLARQMGLTTSAAATEGALAKIERVLPVTVRERAQAVSDTLKLDIWRTQEPAAMDIIVSVSTAIQQRLSIQFHHRKLHDEDGSERCIDPYGIVYRGGRTYVTGYCHLREAIRIFRLDRVTDVKLLDTTFEPPPGFDATEHVVHTLATAPRRWLAKVLLETDMGTARMRIPRGAAVVTEVPEGVLVHCQTEDLDWFARTLLGLGCPLIVQEPEELRDALRRVAVDAASLAERRPELTTPPAS